MWGLLIACAPKMGLVIFAAETFFKNLLQGVCGLLGLN
jgi:hypothetical protein